MKRSTTSLSQTLLNSSKKVAIAVALLLTVGVTSSFATPTDKTDVIKASFKKDFQKAELMGIEANNSYNKLTFKMNDIVLYAFYTDNGELLAVTRNIKSTQLPIQLLLDLKRDYASYWITDLFEFNGDGSNSYYVTLENADTSITLRANSSEEWRLYSRKNK
ncbi:MAG TPA: hypothetical protein VL727_21590 [Puia sp.]|jgi:hypothetical protein|nr:hypothetical protein [Puia sp.]